MIGASVGFATKHSAGVLTAIPRYSRYPECVTHFMRHFLCICAASWIASLATFHPECCAAIVGGIISSDTHWSAANSPYIATSSVLLDAGATLSIEQGVEVRFATGTGLVVVNGTLSARGTIGSPIKFTANQTGAGNGWSGVRFGDLASDAVFDGEEYMSGSVLEGVTIEGVAAHINGAIRLESSSPFIHLSEIRNNLSSGIRAIRADGIQIIGNRIHHNDAGLSSGGGIGIEGGSNIRISNNQIYDNKSNQGGGAKVENSKDATASSGC